MRELRQRCDDLTRRADGAVVLNGDDGDVGACEQCFRTQNSLSKVQTGAARGVEFGHDVQQVIYEGRRGESDLKIGDGECDCVGQSERAVLKPDAPEPFGPAALEEAQIRSMINPTGEVGVFVVHAYCHLLRSLAHRRLSIRGVFLTVLRSNDILSGMKVIFMGAPTFAVPTLKAVAEMGSEIVAVYTRAPQRAGRRGLEITKCPVHRTAESLGLHVETPPTLRDADALARLRAFDADIAVVAAYGLLLPKDALSAPRLGCYNLHASLLPRWRGAAPVQRAIMAGDRETGVSIRTMDVGLDTGAIAGELRTPIDPVETSEELTARLAELAAATMRSNWAALASGQLRFTPQHETGVEYATKISKAEAPVDWSAPAARVRNHIHGLAPFPGAIAEFRHGAVTERLKILHAEVVERTGTPGELLNDQMTIACGEAAIRALQVQRPGRNVISGEDFLRSGAMRVGESFVKPV